MRIVIVNGSLSETSSGSALSRRVIDSVEQLRPEGAAPVTVEWISLRTLGHALVDALYTQMFSAALKGAYAALKEADLIIAVTPTYQASTSGLFKLFWDLLPDGQIRNKPVLLAATGGTGRHGLMIDHSMRPLFAYLGAFPLPTALFAATQDWGDPGLEQQVGVDEPLDRRIARAAAEVWTVAGDQGTASAPTIPTEPAGQESVQASATSAFPGFVDFETLLGNGK